MAGMEQHQASPPQGAAPDWTIDQAYADYSEADHAVWSKLFHRQLAMLEHRACPEFFAGLRALELRPDAIPEFSEVNRRLEALTGWRVIAVPGLVPDAVFFKHLSERRFCAGRFIRSPAGVGVWVGPLSDLRCWRLVVQWRRQSTKTN